MKPLYKYIPISFIAIVFIAIGFTLLGHSRTNVNAPDQKHTVNQNNEVKGATSINISPTLSPTPTLQEKIIPTDTIITATGVYEYSGTKTDISIQFSQNGGSVTGNTTGECTGVVTGVYDGKESINGYATGTCKIFNNNLLSQASYGGIVYKDQEKIVINFQGTSESYSHKGTVTLYFR